MMETFFKVFVDFTGFTLGERIPNQSVVIFVAFLLLKSNLLGCIKHSNSIFDNGSKALKNSIVDYGMKDLNMSLRLNRLHKSIQNVK